MQETELVPASADGADGLGDGATARQSEVGDPHDLELKLGDLQFGDPQLAIRSHDSAETLEEATFEVFELAGEGNGGQFEDAQIAGGQGCGVLPLGLQQHEHPKSNGRSIVDFPRQPQGQAGRDNPAELL